MAVGRWHLLVGGWQLKVGSCLFHVAVVSLAWINVGLTGDVGVGGMRENVVKERGAVVLSISVKLY